jgi:hypothetical protein
MTLQVIVGSGPVGSATAVTGLAVAAVVVGSAVVGLGSLYHVFSRRRELNSWSLATNG